MVPKWQVISNALYLDHNNLFLMSQMWGQVVTTPGQVVTYMIGHRDALNVLYICIIIKPGYHETFRGDFSIFKTFCLHFLHQSRLIRPIMSSFMKYNLFVRGHLGKRPPSWIFDWPIWQNGFYNSTIVTCQLWCLYHSLHDSPQNAHYLFHSNSLFATRWVGFNLHLLQLAPVSPTHGCSYFILLKGNV